MNDMIDRQAVLEAVGPAFARETMLKVRDMTRGIIHEVASRVAPGMVEEDAVEMARDILAANDMVRGWHDVYVRFGANTCAACSTPRVAGGRTKTSAARLSTISRPPRRRAWAGSSTSTCPATGWRIFLMRRSMTGR